MALEGIYESERNAKKSYLVLDDKIDTFTNKIKDYEKQINNLKEQLKNIGE